MAEQGKLSGKVAIVTGASSGIGEATALALAANGAAVALTGRRIERLHEVAQRIEEHGGQAIAIQNDVTNPKQVEAMVRQVMQKWGHIDILVNNAGVMLLGPVLNADLTDWQRMVTTNLLGAMYAVHAVLPIMEAEHGGDIVNISSVAGRTTHPGSAVYNATKWGLNAFSDALRQEVTKDHIRVTLIEPGYVNTELREHITNQQAKQESEAYGQTIQQLESEDIAAAVIYAVTQPPRVSINEILVRPTEQVR
jgi:NADP-dependent 3-hydroxy acid dehydrogenase YdfG